jgi:hypothetical protein
MANSTPDGGLVSRRDGILRELDELCVRCTITGFIGPAMVIATLHGAICGERDRIAEGRSRIDPPDFARRLAIALLDAAEAEDGLVLDDVRGALGDFLPHPATSPTGPPQHAPEEGAKP